MKYVISESQHKFLIESVIPSWFKRRIDKDTLMKYVYQAELEYPMLCDYFSNPTDYSESIIDWVVDKLIEEYENNTNRDFVDDDSYNDTVDYLRDLLRTNFGEYSINVYIQTCYEN